MYRTRTRPARYDTGQIRSTQLDAQKQKLNAAISAFLSSDKGTDAKVAAIAELNKIERSIYSIAASVLSTG